MPKTRVELLLSCPSCRSPVEEHLDFCHSCGETMTHPPAVRRESRPSLVMVAASILACACAVIMAITIFDFNHQYGVPGAPDVEQRAQLFIGQGQEDRAINLLEESIQIKSNDQRVKKWQELLDQALCSQGKKLAAQGKYRDAVTSFARISGTYSEHDEVEKLISEYSEKGLPAVFGRSSDTDMPVIKEKRSLSKLEKAVMTAVPGGKEHVDPMPSPIGGGAPVLPTTDQVVRP